MACRRTAGRKVGTCETCGKTFEDKASRVGRFCSRQCGTGRPRDESKWTTKTCPGCGKQFDVPDWREIEHCSRACRKKATTIDGICAYCGKEFQFYQSWPRVHCSSFCYGQGRSSETPGRFYYGPNWQVQRAFAIVRDEGKCVDCERTDNLYVHHIKSLRSFGGDWASANVLENLVTVCPPHHLMRHGGHY